MVLRWCPVMLVSYFSPKCLCSLRTRRREPSPQPVLSQAPALQMPDTPVWAPSEREHRRSCAGTAQGSWGLRFLWAPTSFLWKWAGHVGEQVPLGAGTGLLGRAPGDGLALSFGPGLEIQATVGLMALLPMKGQGPQAPWPGSLLGVFSLGQQISGIILHLLKPGHSQNKLKMCKITKKANCIKTQQVLHNLF